jgi:hypothetical protein
LGKRLAIVTLALGVLLAIGVSMCAPRDPLPERPAAAPPYAPPP